MGSILQPGFLYWDGLKYVLVPGVVGPPGPPGATGPMGANGNAVFIFRPGGVAAGNVYTSWPTLYTAASAIEGDVFITVDDSITSPAIVPSGTYTFTNWYFDGVSNFNSFSGGAVLQFAAGVSITTPTTISFNQIDVQYAGTTTCITPASNQEVNLNFINGAGCASSNTGLFASGGGAGGFVNILGFSSRFGDGANAVFGGVTDDLFVFVYDKAFVVNNSIAAVNSNGARVSGDASVNIQSQPANVTIDLIDDSAQVLYTPNTSSDWSGTVSGVPTAAAGALDTLAAFNFNQSKNANTVSGAGSPVTLNDATNPYNPGVGAKAVLVTITFAGTITGEGTAVVNVQPLRGGSNLGMASSVSVVSTIFSGCVTVLDTTQPPAAVRYGVTFTAAGGTFTLGVSSVQFTKVDIG